MQNDLQLREAVLNHLALEAKIDPLALAVSVTDGVVTLGGTLETDEDRRFTERMVRSIVGVKGVVDDDLKVPRVTRTRPDDARIKQAAEEAIDWLTTVPRDAIEVSARDGWISLEGQVESLSQVRCIEAVLAGLPGVRGVKNGLTVLQPQQAA